MTGAYKKHFVYQVDYQHWANEVLFNSLDRLDEAGRQSAQGLFFSSIHHTVDHMLTVNKLWLGRLRREQSFPTSFNTIYQPVWRDLKNHFRAHLREMQHWLEAQSDDFFEDELHYTSSDGERRHNWIHDILTHMMTHMAHHRGQVSAVATRLGAPAPEMDFLYYKRAMQKGLEKIAENRPHKDGANGAARVHP